MKQKEVGKQMTYLSKAIILCAGLALTACTNPDRFGSGGAGGAGAGAYAPGSAQDPKSPLVGTELVGTSMTSAGNGGNVIPEYERAADQNDFVKFYNSNRGYVSCELTPENWTSWFRATPFVDKPGSPLETKATFVIENGQPGAKQA